MIETKFARVPLQNISLASFNPKSRVTPEAMKDLAQDVAAVGVLNPVLLVEVGVGRRPFLIADGHRRYEAATLAGLEEIPAVVVKGMTVSEAYRRQFITKRPSGKEVLAIYLDTPDALPPKISKVLDRELETYGRSAMRQYQAKGASPNAFGIVRKIDKYLAGSLPTNMTYGKSGRRENLKTIADWLFATAQQAKAVYAIEHRTSPRFLWRAIQDGKRLELVAQEE